MSTFSDLKAIAIQIKNETSIGAITANRIGGFLENLLNLAGNIGDYQAPVEVEIETGKEFDLTTAHRYCSIVCATDNQKVNLLQSNLVGGLKHTLINSGSKIINITPIRRADGGDIINGETVAIELLPGKVITIMSFVNSGWWVIGN